MISFVYFILFLQKLYNIENNVCFVKSCFLKFMRFSYILYYLPTDKKLFSVSIKNNTYMVYRKSGTSDHINNHQNENKVSNAK